LTFEFKPAFVKKRYRLEAVFIGLTLGAAGAARAGAAPAATPAATPAAAPAASTASAAGFGVAPSTAPLQVYQTGETKSLPPPRGLTQAPDGGVFVTLTRTAYSPERLPTDAQIITPEEFKKYGAETVGEAVARATSISVPMTGGLGTLNLAGIRGATSNQTLVLIDGRPVGGVALSASQDLSEIPIEQVDHIEIVRGGVSALYGPNAIGGVINVITKRATYNGTPLSHAGYESASYGRQIYRLDFGSRAGPLDYFFFGNRQWESGFRDNSDASDDNIGGNVGLSLGKAGKLLFDIASYHSNAGIPGELFPAIPVNQFDNGVEKAAQTPNARQLTDTNYIRSSYLLPLPMNSLMSLRAFGSQRQVGYTDPDNFVNSDRAEQSKGGEVQFTLPLGLLVGGNFIRDRLDSRDHITPLNSYAASVENWGVFAQDTMRWNAFTLIPSGRFDHNSTAGDSKNPRVQAIADALPWLRFSASAARSVRAPTIDDLFTPFTNFGGGFSYQGNPNLRPERAWTYDGGFELHQDSASFKATYFRANVNDLIQTTSDLASTTINIGSARRQGAEIEISQVVNAYFRHSWNYTYLQNRGIPPGYDHPVALAMSPRHTVNYITTFTPFRHFTWDNTFQYLDSRFEGNDETGEKLNARLLWGMRFSYEVRQMEFYVGGENLTNKHYEDRAGYPLPGITAYGGVKLRLWG